METKPKRQSGSAVPDRSSIGAKWSLEALADEITTYRARLSEMVKEHEGEFALIKLTEIVGFFPDESSAVREGHSRFGISPFLIKQITASEHVIYIPNVVL
jgi:hypothetical protein